VPIVTQEREFPARTPDALHRIDGYSVPTEQQAHSPGHQKTTSYRSINRNAVDESRDSFVSESGSRIDFMRELREENRTLGYDTGHEFSTEKWTYTIGLEQAYMRRTFYGTQIRAYTGWAMPDPYYTYSPWYEPPLPTQAEINANGAKCVAMTIPTEPEAGVAAFFGELREGLPKIVGLQALRGGLSQAHKSLGSEHLNIQFGIKPLIGDLEKTALGVLRAAKTARQYIRDSDRLVRRKATLLETNETAIGYYGGTPAIARRYGEIVASDFFVGPYGSTHVADEVRQRVTFSGAYTYHVAQGMDFLAKLDRYEALANKALGVRFDPNVAWQLTPWSWLVDWFADAGSFVQNVNALANDSLVMKYGYVMHETVSTRTRTLQVQPYEVGPSVLWTTNEYTRKLRHRATPYGFGLDVGTFSPRRWAILGALGLTRSPNALH